MTLVKYDLISADSHLEIDAKWWRDRVPAAYRDQAPRVVRLPDGSDAWLIEGQPLRPFHYHNLGDMATIGRASAVANLPLFQLKGFIGWLAWERSA